jgi:Acyl-coenzyme A:6-aminopenicillanic acid acyl-transferase
MLDCLWGLLDGINDAGLAVSQTFGGRPEVGEGFGIPLVIRYVLEVCGTVQEAIRVLHRVPVHMSYNVTAVDRAGRRATAYLAPDRPARITGRAMATNHQGEVEWAPYAAAIRSVSASSGSRSCSPTAPAHPASPRRACSPRCTPPALIRASGPCTPPITGRARG